MGRGFLNVFGIRSKDEKVEKVAAYAVRQGYAVVPIRPGTKAPDLCTLTDREKKVAGDHDCGVHHAITDPTVALRVFKREAKKYEDPLNVGVVAWPSRLIVVDADNTGPCEAFLADWAAAEGDEGYLTHSPTVKTPGAIGEDGKWKHKDGGHWYFTVPEGVDLELGRQVIKAKGGYDIRWGWSMTVVPPSTRPEGPYVPTGDVLDAPQFLIDMILEDCARVTEKRARHEEMFVNDAIAQWSLEVGWGTLLVEDGWRDTSKLDSCGCPIFEKPAGGSTTVKSATAHNGECTYYENFEKHGPLHLWTTDPPPPLDEWDSDTITKLQYVALTRYGNDIDAAKVGERISPDNSWVTELPEAETEEPAPKPATGKQQPPLSERMLELARAELLKAGLPPEHTEKLTKSATDKSVMVLAEVVARRFLGDPGTEPATLASWFPTEDFEKQWLESVEEPPPSILARTDGVCLFCEGRVNMIVGRKAAGKTWLAMLAALFVLEAGGRVLYHDMEDQLRAFRYRYKTTLGVAIDQYVENGQLKWVKPGDLPTGDMEKLIEYATTFDLVVYDVQNRLITRLGGNPDAGNKEVMWLYDNLFDPIANTGSTVLVLDHPNRRGQRKDATHDDIGPGGGILKQNNLSGVAVSLLVDKPFTRDDPNGRVRLVCLKDRTGHFEEEKVIGRMVGSLDLSEETGGLALQMLVVPPDEEDEKSEDQRLLEATKARIIEIVTEHGPQVKKRLVHDLLTKRHRPFKEQAVAELLLVDHLLIETDEGLSLVDGGSGGDGDTPRV